MKIPLLITAVLFLGGCQPAKVAHPLTGNLAGNDPGRSPGGGRLCVAGAARSAAHRCSANPDTSGQPTRHAYRKIENPSRMKSALSPGLCAVVLASEM